MALKTYHKYIVEQNAIRNTLIFKVWEPIKKGRYYREVKKIEGKLYGRLGTKYPYIKKTKKMNNEEHIQYKKHVEKQAFETAYQVVEICYPEIFMNDFMFVDGEVLVVTK